MGYILFYYEKIIEQPFMAVVRGLHGMSRRHKAASYSAMKLQHHDYSLLTINIDDQRAVMSSYE